MHAGSLQTRRSLLPFGLEIRHLSGQCFPILYQVLFTYLILIADLVGPTLGRTGFVAIALVGMLLSSLSSLWIMKSRRFDVGYFRVALPMLIALLLPLVQIGLLNWIG
jgi:hypothetical protein